MVQLLASWGVQPSAVIGHLSGEIAVAFAAGYVSSAEAITAAYYRGYVVGKHTMDGAIMAAGMSREAAEETVIAAGVSVKSGLLVSTLRKVLQYLEMLPQLISF